LRFNAARSGDQSEEWEALEVTSSKMKRVASEEPDMTRAYAYWAPAAAGVIAVIGSLSTAMAGSFDGNWGVSVSCAATGDGAKSYNWQFPATIRNGVVQGQYRTPGAIPSGTLTGRVAESGDGSLQMRGIAGDSEYTVGRKGGVPFRYTVRAHFNGGSGSGNRVELRSCNLSFSRS
jgi:hypothetical protein